MAFGIGGVAFAYFASTGTGTGTATTGIGESNLTITQTSTLSGLAPGVDAEAITGTVTNGNTDGGAAQYVNTVTVSIGSVTEAEDAPTGYTCSATDYTLTDPVMTVGQEIAAGDSADFSGATIAFNDLSEQDQDACEGATVNLVYTSS